MMKKYILALITVTALGFFTAGASAQGMMGGTAVSGADWDEILEHTASEEKEGKELWEKLQAKSITCAELSDGEFEALGEYFMGVMMGDLHASMNAMMTQMHGEEGEEQIHLVMGKRLSGCDLDAVSSVGASGGWMPMMNMLAPYGTEGSRMGMGGEWSSPFGFNSTNNMMNYGGSMGFGGGIGSIFGLFSEIVWFIAGSLLIVWLWRQINSKP